MVKYYNVKVETEPFEECKIDNDLKKVDLVYNVSTTKKKRIKRWCKEHKRERFWEEEIIYIHRYPSTGDTLIGVKRLIEIDYFI